MKTSLHGTPTFGKLDDLLFLVALFAPVSLLLTGALARVALGA